MTCYRWYDNFIKRIFFYLYQQPTAPPARKPPTSEPEDFSPLDAKPVERQIEARPVEDSVGSFVRCLHFARTFLINGKFTLSLISLLTSSKQVTIPWFWFNFLHSTNYGSDTLGRYQQRNRIRFPHQGTFSVEKENGRRCMPFSQGNTIKTQVGNLKILNIYERWVFHCLWLGKQKLFKVWTYSLLSYILNIFLGRL